MTPERKAELRASWSDRVALRKRFVLHPPQFAAGAEHDVVELLNALDAAEDIGATVEQCIARIDALCDERHVLLRNAAKAEARIAKLEAVAAAARSVLIFTGYDGTHPDVLVPGYFQVLSGALAALDKKEANDE